MLLHLPGHQNLKSSNWNPRSSHSRILCTRYENRRPTCACDLRRSAKTPKVRWPLTERLCWWQGVSICSKTAGYICRGINFYWNHSWLLSNHVLYRHSHTITCTYGDKWSRLWIDAKAFQYVHRLHCDCCSKLVEVFIHEHEVDEQYRPTDGNPDNGGNEFDIAPSIRCTKRALIVSSAFTRTASFNCPMYVNSPWCTSVINQQHSESLHL